MSVLLWDITGLQKIQSNPIERACSVTGRGLDADEWGIVAPEWRCCPAHRQPRTSSCQPRTSSSGKRLPKSAPLRSAPRLVERARL
jgi:hypothetical protein